MEATRADVLIIGAGIIGLSIAYHLLRRAPGLKVALLEKEYAPGTGSTARATGGIRFQFSTAANIQLSLLSHPEWERFHEEFGVDIRLRRHGYLFVSGNPDIVAGFGQQAALQQSLGLPTRLLSPHEISLLVPAMATADLRRGAFCPWDGSADPYSALTGYWHRVRELGGQIVSSTEVVEITQEGGRVSGVQTSQGRWLAPTVVNAAGPYAGEVGRMAGINVPVRPYKRSVFVAEPLKELGEGLPLCVDMDTGWYVHRDHRGKLLLGGTDKVAHAGFATNVSWDDLERVLSAAVQRFPCMGQAQISSAYAGLREITPDFHAVLGPAPDLPGFYLACGFSGHGFMHAPAAGILMAEFILDGKAHSMDAGPLLLERFRSGEPNEEAAAF